MLDYLSRTVFLNLSALSFSLVSLQHAFSFFIRYIDLFAYLSIDGDHDWMNPEGGELSVKRLNAAGNNNTRMYIITDAGHHGREHSINSTILPCAYAELLQ